jgi:FMN reductase
MRNHRPRILGIGGTTRSPSSTEKALRIALAAAERRGAEVREICGAALMLPMYDPQSRERNAASSEFVDALRNADGLVVSSPAYHGSISGMLKNALDYVEDLREDRRVYLDGMPVGLIICGSGWQGLGHTLGTLRTIVHSLRGWPTPLGVTINSLETRLDETQDRNEPVMRQLAMVGEQVAEFVEWRSHEFARVGA